MDDRIKDRGGWPLVAGHDQRVRVYPRGLGGPEPSSFTGLVVGLSRSEKYPQGIVEVLNEATLGRHHAPSDRVSVRPGKKSEEILSEMSRAAWKKSKRSKGGGR